MLTLQKLESAIFDVEGIQVSLSGNAPVIKEYWLTKFTADGTVSEYRSRFLRRYPGIEIVLYDGIGRPANGNYLLRNLRGTYEFAWVQKEHENELGSWKDFCRDQYKEIKELKKSLRKSLKSAAVEMYAFDPYEVLGVKPDSSYEEIRLAYKKRVQVLHPDKFPNMDPLVIEFANEKTQRFNRAWAEITQQRGEAKAD